MIVTRRKAAANPAASSSWMTTTVATNTRVRATATHHVAFVTTST
jgi:hypothetical protein